MAKARRPKGQVIEKGPGKWLVRVFLGKDDTGKRKYLAETVTGKLTDAKKKLTHLQGQADKGDLVAPEKHLTVSAYMQRWLNDGCRHLKRYTRENYEQMIRLYVTPRIGQKDLAKLKPLDVQSWVNALSDSGLGARTVRLTFSIFRTAMLRAERWQVITKTPCQFIEQPRLESKPRKVIEPQQVKAFLEAASDHTFGCITTFGLCTGARPGEIMGVLWEDLNLNEATWTLQRSLVRYKSGGWSLEAPKTEAGIRTVSLPQTLVAMLRTHKAEQAKQRLAAGPVWEDHGLVFCTKVGRPYCRANVANYGLKPILELAGLSRELCIYSLRHSLATNMYSQGQQPRLVAEQLGHADPAFTMKTYGRVTKSMLTSVAARIEADFFGATEPGTPVGTPVPASSKETA